MRVGTISLGVIAVLLLLVQGCQLMMYPCARAFGSPSESELKQCRAAFEHLKEGRTTARTVVYPVVNPRQEQPMALAGTAAYVAEQLQAKGWTNCTIATNPPAVAGTPLGHNQLRYMWDRAHGYSQWVRDSQPAGDFHLFIEILSARSGEIIGIHCYVVDATGQIAYVRLSNSHHFGDQPPQDSEAACQFILKFLLHSLESPAEIVFPKYGVG